MGFDSFGEELGKLKRQHDDDTRPQLGRGGDPIVWLELYNQDLKIDNHDIFINQCDTVGSYLIWDHSLPSVHGWDNGSWATQTTMSASPEFSCSRVKEIRIHQSFIENFLTVDYKDGGVTTGSWGTVGSLTFTVGSTLAQSIKVLGSDVQLGSINRVTMTIEGSYTQTLSGLVSVNGSSTWQGITFGHEKTLTSGLGSDVRWIISAILGAGETTIVESVNIEIKSDDY